MAEKKKPAVVKALIFKSATKNGNIDNNIVKKGGRIIANKLVPKELNFFDVTPNAERKPFKPTENRNSTIKPSRLLVYEDSPGDSEPVKTTPPNVRERDEGTPGAPTKGRKDIEKKALRPKKLVYNDADSVEEEDCSDEDYSSYRDTPKKSTRKEPEFGTLRRRIFARDSSTSSSGRIGEKPRSQMGSRKKSYFNNPRDVARIRSSKIDSLTYNKENNAAVRLGDQSDQETREKLESHKSRAALEFIVSHKMVRNGFNRRNTLIPIEAGGIWIECCYRGCKKWRYSYDYEDPIDVPVNWYCHMNSDEATNTCSAPESTEISEHEVFVFSAYKAGSIVWAKVVGHPWSPAMVDFCPEYECYYWFDGDATEPTQYHVTFLNKDKVTRSWVKCNAIKPFVQNEDPSFALNAKVRGKKLSAKKKAAILTGCQIARDALSLTLVKRLRKYDVEAWRIAKQTHNLLKTPGIIDKPPPPDALPKKQKKPAKSKKIAGPSNITLRNRKVSPEIEIPPPKDNAGQSEASTKKKVAPKAIGGVKKSSAEKEKPAFVKLRGKPDVQDSQSSRTNTTASVTDVEKESPDLDDTRSVNSVYTDPAVIQQQKQIVEISVENGPSVRIVSNENFTAENIADMVNESIGDYVPSSQNSTPSKLSFTLRVSNEDGERGGSPEIILSQPENFEAVLKSPEDSRPSNLSLKLKSMREERLSNIKVRASSENSMGKDKRNEIRPEESRYLRALSEFTINENRKQDYKLRPLQPPKQLPEWSANREKRNEVLAQRANKLMSQISSEEESKMYKENRVKFIAEQQRAGPSRDPRLNAGPSNSRDHRLQRNGNNSEGLLQLRKSGQDLITSDEDSSF